MTFHPPFPLPALPTSAARLLIAALAVLLAAVTQWYSGAPGDETVRDLMVRLHASAAPEERVVVVDIDEASLRRAGAWPWPRERLAHLIENLIGPYGAAGVGLDIVLPEPADADGDQRLAMLAQHGPLVLPHSFVFDGNSQLQVGRLRPGHQPPAAGAVAARGYVANHAGLGQAAHIGNIGFIPDDDGMLRRLPMQTRYRDATYPALSLALLDCCAAAAGAGRPGPLGGLDSGNGLRRIPYSRSWEAYTVVPAADVLEQRLPADWFQGRLVLIGSSALGLADRVATPLSANTSGVLVHAAAVSALLDARAGLAPAPWPGRWLALLFVLLLTAVTLYTLARLPAWANTVLLVAGAVLWLGLAGAITPHDGEFSPAGPLLSILFLLLVGVPYAWQLAQRQARKLLGTLRQYVADAVVDELLRLNLDDPLAPVHCEVTTLIADMQGYTTHVAALPVEQAAQLTRDFLACLTGPVLERHGTIDKFTGDGLVAFWGAPLPVADHADQALDAAHAMLANVAALNAARARRGEAPLRVRIGIESGRAMAGDFGAGGRSIYTAVGDSVNVASRLETAARDYPCDVLVGPGTAARARPQRLTLVGHVLLRGREQDTALYTLSSGADQKG